MRIDSLRAAAQMLNLDINNLTAKLNAGDVLSVQVLGVTKDEVVLRLPDGKTISANTLVPMGLTVGDTIDLVVNEKRDGKVFLETLKASTETGAKTLSTEQIQNLLASMKLPVNSRNIDIVREMISREVPVNKQNAQSVMNNMVRYPSLDTQKAVFMVACGLEFEEKSINMLNQYAEGKAALGNQVRTLLNQVENINDYELLKLIYDKLTQHQERSLSKELAAAVVQNTEVKSKADNKSTVQNRAVITGSQDDGANNTQLYGEKNQSALGQIQKDILPLIRQYILDNVEANLKESGNMQLSGSAKQAMDNIKQLVANMKPDELEQIAAKLSVNEKGVLEQIVKNLNGNENTKAVLSDDNNDISRIKSQITSFFEKHFIKLDSGNLSEELHIKDSYKELLVKLEILRECVGQREGRSDFLNLIGQTEENIKFMNSLSQYNTYIQIPLNIWGQNTNGQLFVLKKARKIDPGNASIFLSLEMPNMGLTEVLVNVLGKNVTCIFRVEDEKTVQLVRKYSVQLVGALNNQGYNSISIECGLIQKQTGILDMDKITQQSIHGRKQSFDVRV